MDLSRQTPPNSTATSAEDTLRPLLEEHERAGLRRVRSVLTTPQGVEVKIDGRRYLSFCSNNYLGLANDPRVVAAFQRGAGRYGVGSGAASVVAGHYRAHHALEEELAAFTGRERALIFSTGYMANLGIVSALAGRGDAVFEDRLNHASLLDAATLSRAHLKRYAHTDPAALWAALAAGNGAKRRLVVTDGVFSMDGDVAPLPALAAIGREYGAWLVVDDAHGLGVLGKNGGGSLEHFGLGSDAVPILMGTLGKALGVFGAFVAGDHAVVEYLMQKARPFIFTTALPPAVAEAARASLAIVREEPWRREHLMGLVVRFRAGAEGLGLTLGGAATTGREPDRSPSEREPAPRKGPISNETAVRSPRTPGLYQSLSKHASTPRKGPISNETAVRSTPIQPVLVGDSHRAVAISAALRKKGFFVQAIRPPTVPKGSARLRITFSATHEPMQVDRLLDALSDVFS
uniref:8-amino-7-oxononanoate synthase n=1 Tax=Candidatus Kentrum sp. FM TaxID=2126340 RepID=A0A450TUD7_9GAMM|nr:MAG: 8-amino-7-oxononanoate synthase [Candidatus Kentron sp. FM]VFJ72478.1 MAG: 8-amino-7-oxononanoate synthase [Candidatus Kentron sp. FM]VFK19704.1 MAG: 8-amino-7-oxononanoate synthase [Candidatus Kentron sp. FM]